MVRIDSTLDLLWQLGYLVIITTLMISQARVVQGRWTPSGFLGKIWHYETEALHFCYGGLLSGYVVFYFKSTSFSRSLVFFALIAVLMILNEMPQIRKWGAMLRLGLYSFCVVSYLNYLFPVLIGRMGWMIFFLGWIVACVVTHFVIKAVVRYEADPPRAFSRLSISPTAVLLLILALYSFKLIPPVPLSLRHLGVYRAVEKEGNHYRLFTRQTPWYRFWDTDSRRFPARPGDPVYAFISVFGPRRFSHTIYIRWSTWNAAGNKWATSDRFPMPLTGGRDDGFRGSMKKENYALGRWRIDIETEDGRVLGSRVFDIESDTSTGERALSVRET